MKAGKTALITGASSGIGYELSKIFARNGYDLILNARGAARLEEVAAEIRRAYTVETRVLPLDLSVPDAAQQVYHALEGTQVDVLINNAGFADFNPLAEADPAKLNAMMQTNMVSLTLMTRYFLPGMVARRHGYIMNLGSTASFMPGPLMAVYYATKAYVLSFSTAVAEEVKDYNVRVTAYCPGPTASGFQARAAMEDSKLVQNRKLPDAASVAEEGYQALMAGKTVRIHGAMNRLQAMTGYFLPRSMVAKMVKKAQEAV